MFCFPPANDYSHIQSSNTTMFQDLFLDTTFQDPSIESLNDLDADYFLESRPAKDLSFDIDMRNAFEPYFPPYNQMDDFYYGTTGDPIGSNIVESSPRLENNNTDSTLNTIVDESNTSLMEVWGSQKINNITDNSNLSCPTSFPKKSYSNSFYADENSCILRDTPDLDDSIRPIKRARSHNDINVTQGSNFPGEKIENTRSVSTTVHSNKTPTRQSQDKVFKPVALSKSMSSKSCFQHNAGNPFYVPPSYLSSRRSSSSSSKSSVSSVSLGSSYSSNINNSNSILRTPSPASSSRSRSKDTITVYAKSSPISCDNINTQLQTVSRNQSKSNSKIFVNDTSSKEDIVKKTTNISPIDHTVVAFRVANFQQNKTCDHYRSGSKSLFGSRNSGSNSKRKKSINLKSNKTTIPECTMFYTFNIHTGCSLEL